MSDRALVINSRGGVREVAASAVPLLARSGWRPLTDDELAAHQQETADARAARVESFMPASARRGSPRQLPAEPAPAPPAPTPPHPPAEGEEPASGDGATAPRRSGAKRRQDTETETKEG